MEKRPRLRHKPRSINDGKHRAPTFPIDKFEAEKSGEETISRGRISLLSIDWQLRSWKIKPSLLIPAYRRSVSPSPAHALHPPPSKPPTPLGQVRPEMRRKKHRDPELFGLLRPLVLSRQSLRFSAMTMQRREWHANFIE
jgi:hypothetical protein